MERAKLGAMELLGMLTIFVSDLGKMAKIGRYHAEELLRLLLDFSEKISGRQMHCWIAAFKKFLKKEDPFSEKGSRDKTWRTFGPLRNLAWLLKQVKLGEIEVCGFADEVLDAIMLIPEEDNDQTSIETVTVPEDEMWLETDDPREAIAWGLRRGLKLCPQRIPFQCALWAFSFPKVLSGRHFVFATMEYVSCDNKTEYLLAMTLSQAEKTRISALLPANEFRGRRYWVFAK
jgi:hypothetical protein